MNIVRHRRRTLRKLALPLIAVSVMAVMMYLHSNNSTPPGAASAAYGFYSR